MMRGITRAFGGDAERVAGAQHVGGGLGEIRAVDAAAERDDDRAHVGAGSSAAQASLVPVLFLLIVFVVDVVEIGLVFLV